MGRFRAKVSENTTFRCDSLTGSPNCEPSVRTGYSSPMGKCSLRFRNFGAAVSRSGPSAGHFRAEVSENPTFRCNFLTDSPNCEPSAPTSYSTPKGSARASFRIFPQPFPIPDPRRAVFEPKCSRIPRFGVILSPVVRIANRPFLLVIL